MITSTKLLNALKIIYIYEQSIEAPESEWVKKTPHGLTPAIDITAGLNAVESIIQHACSCADYLRFGREVDMCLAGRLDRYTAVMIRATTPELLRAVGCADLPWLHTQMHLRNELHEKNPSNRSWHGLSKAQLKALPELLERPCVVLDNPANKCGLVCVLDQTDSDGLPIIMPFAPDGHGSYQGEEILTNFVLSVYGREGFSQYLERAAEQQRILYIDVEKTRKLMSCVGLELPEACMSFEGIIHPSRQIVKAAQSPKPASERGAERRSSSGDAR